MFHGGKDSMVPIENVNKIYDSVPQGIYKEKHIFENSEHTRCVVDQYRKYQQIVNEFVDKYTK